MLRLADPIEKFPQLMVRAVPVGVMQKTVGGDTGYTGSIGDYKETNFVRPSRPWRIPTALDSESGVCC